MSALPHIGRTLNQRRNRRDMRVCNPAGVYAEQQREADEAAQIQRQMATVTELLPVEPSAFIRAAGESCCAVPNPGEDGEPQVMAWVGSTPVLIILALACVAWVAYFWGTP